MTMKLHIGSYEDEELVSDSVLIYMGSLFYLSKKNLYWTIVLGNGYGDEVAYCASFWCNMKLGYSLGFIHDIVCCHANIAMFLLQAL